MKAFTLIEVLVYLGLFAVIVGGAAASAQSLIESSGRSATEAMLQEEGDFLVAKIEWALSGAKAFNAPAANAAGGMLSVSKWVAPPEEDPIAISLSNGEMRISEGGSSEALNNSDVSVSTLLFTHTSKGSENPESMSASFTLSAKTPNGMTVSKRFSTVSYLRK